jgi:hypothetical protein
VPAGVVKDNQFPLAFNDKVRIRIEGKRFIVEKV